MQTGLNLLFYPDPWGSAGIYTPGPENGQDAHSSATPIVERGGGVEGQAAGVSQEREEGSGNTHGADSQLKFSCPGVGGRGGCFNDPTRSLRMELDGRGGGVVGGVRKVPLLCTFFHSFRERERERPSTREATFWSNLSLPEKEKKRRKHCAANNHHYLFPHYTGYDLGLRKET